MNYKLKIPSLQAVFCLSTETAVNYLQKSHYEIRIDEEINRFYPEISENIEIISDIPEEKAILILNKLLAYVCDASNIMLIWYAKELIKKMPAEWFRNNVQKVVKLRTGDCWILDLNDPYVYGSLKDFLAEMDCSDKMPE